MDNLLYVIHTIVNDALNGNEYAKSVLKDATFKSNQVANLLKIDNRTFKQIKDLMSIEKWIFNLQDLFDIKQFKNSDEYLKAIRNAYILHSPNCLSAKEIMIYLDLKYKRKIFAAENSISSYLKKHGLIDNDIYTEYGYWQIYEESRRWRYTEEAVEFIESKIENGEL